MSATSGEDDGLGAMASALRELGLTPPVSLAEIKKAYRERSRELHPDRNRALSHESSDDRPALNETGRNDAMIRLNAAYRLLSDYVARFRYRFNSDEYFEQNPRERVRMQFADSENWRKTPRRRIRKNLGDL
jgi:curved DNA-binding protein CbpA